MSPPAPPVFGRWEDFVHWLMDHTVKFPRRLRHTLTNRIDNLALDVFQDLIRARYRRHERREALERVDLKLEQIRLLMRLAHDRQVLSHGAFEEAIERLDGVGREVGGWLRSQPTEGEPHR